MTVISAACLRGLNDSDYEVRGEAVVGASELVTSTLKELLTALGPPFAGRAATPYPQNRKTKAPEHRGIAITVGGVALEVWAGREGAAPKEMVLYATFTVRPVRGGQGGFISAHADTWEQTKAFSHANGGWTTIHEKRVKRLEIGFELARASKDATEPTVNLETLHAIADQLRPLVVDCVVEHRDYHRSRHYDLNAALPPTPADTGVGPGDDTLVERAEVVDALVAAMTVRPLVLLAGVSGSGKTQIACRLGRARSWLPELLDADDSAPFVVRARNALQGSGVITEANADGWLYVLPLPGTPAATAGTPDEEELVGGADPGTGEEEADDDAAGDTEEDDELDGELDAPMEAAAVESSSFELVPVRPDWHEASSLWGWREKDEFHGSPVLRVFLDAWLQSQGPPAGIVRHVVVLDEMNLSRLEHYGSDLLSAMERQGEAIIRLHDAGQAIPLAGGGGKMVPERIGWAPGLCVIGTVNVDETTFSFAPKVLDRAAVLEFLDVRLEYAFTAWDKGEHWLRLQPWFDAVQAALQPHSLHLGYRAAREVVDMIEAHRGQPAQWGQDAAGSPLRKALDRQLLSKVLPRVRGPRGTAEPVLLDLLALAIAGTDTEARSTQRTALQQQAEEGFANQKAMADLLKAAVYPHAAAKAKVMLDRLSGIGFTGFF